MMRLLPIYLVQENLVLLKNTIIKVSVFRFQLQHFFFLTPDTRNLAPCNFSCGVPILWAGPRFGGWDLIFCGFAVHILNAPIANSRWLQTACCPLPVHYLRGWWHTGKIFVKKVYLPGSGFLAANNWATKSAPSFQRAIRRGFNLARFREKNHELFFGLTKSGVNI
jgi:hypothetical protein